MKNTRKWSRDWSEFDWGPVIEKLKAMKENEGNADYDVGITKAEFLEYLDWLNQTDKEGFYKAVLSIQFSEMGFDEEQIETLLSHPDELIQFMESILKE